MYEICTECGVGSWCSGMNARFLLAHAWVMGHITLDEVAEVMSVCPVASDGVTHEPCDGVTP